ncbi:MAG: hypothetical protein ACHP79_14400, partial [Terriglobales bacterium]
MKRPLCMFLLAAMMATTAVAFAAKSPFSKERVGGCNSVCRRDSDCTSTQCPTCAPFYRNGVVASA